MAFDSEDKKTDFDAWADEMTYAEEKEIKKQEKLQQKQDKKAEKAAKKAAKKNAKSGDAAENSEEAVQGTPAGETAEASEISQVAENTEAAENTDSAEGTEASDEKDESNKDNVNTDYVKEKKTKAPEEINIVKELFSLIIYIGVVIIICYCIITYVGQRTTVNGRSMESTLHDGDNLWIDKFTYHFKDPERFDIVVFPYEDDVYYIKRIIGLPGERVQILADGTIMINGKRLVESYGKEIILESGTAAEERTLAEDEYFVLGDNRNDSRDSRWADVGDISKDIIIGKAVFRLSPLSKFGKIDK